VHDDLRFPSVFVLSLPTKGDESITKNSQDCVDPNHMREFYQKFHGADDSTEDSLLCLKNMIGPHQISNAIEEGSYHLQELTWEVILTGRDVIFNFEFHKDCCVSFTKENAKLTPVVSAYPTMWVPSNLE